MSIASQIYAAIAVHHPDQPTASQAGTRMARRIATLFRRLGDVVHPQQKRDEAYLNDAFDVYDLERRMRELDRRRADPAHMNVF